MSEKIVDISLIHDRLEIDSEAVTPGEIKLQLVNPATSSISCGKAVIELPFGKLDEADAFISSNDFAVNPQDWSSDDPPFQIENKKVWVELLNDLKKIPDEGLVLFSLYDLKIIPNPKGRSERDVSISVSLYEQMDSEEPFQQQDIKLHLENRGTAPYVNYFASDVFTVSKEDVVTLRWSMSNTRKRLLYPIFLSDKDQLRDVPPTVRSDKALTDQEGPIVIDSQTPIVITQDTGSLEVKLIKSTQFKLVADVEAGQGVAQLVLYLKDLTIVQFRAMLDGDTADYGRALGLKWIFTFTNNKDPKNKALLVCQEFDRYGKIIQPMIKPEGVDLPPGTMASKVIEIDPLNFNHSLLVYPCWNTKYMLLLIEEDAKGKSDFFFLKVRSGTPIGTILFYPGGKAPKGWAVCDGRSISKTDIGADSFEALARSLGIDPNENQLVLPNLTDHFAVGAGEDAALRSNDGPDPHTHEIKGQSQEFTTSANGKHAHKYTSAWYKRNLDNPGWFDKEHTGLDTGGGNVAKQSTQAEPDHTHKVEVSVPDRRTGGVEGGHRPKYAAMSYIIRIAMNSMASIH
ncbi:MAG: phage tail protein [Bacteroidota bacterium]